MATESPKQKEKALEPIGNAEPIVEAEIVEESDHTKKKSSASGVELAKELPQPPAPAQAKGRSLLATDTGEDIEFLDDDSDEDAEIDLVANQKAKELYKPRKSFSFRFFGAGAKNKQIHKNKAARPGSMFAFLLPKPANSTYNNVKGAKGKVESEDSRIDSVAWRRKESIEMTKSLKMDMDIYQYLKERSPSFEEEEKFEIDEPKNVLPAPKKRKQSKNGKGGTTSNLLVGGGVREATKAPHLELQRRKKRGGFFGRFKIFGRNKENNGKQGFASRLMSRMSFRPTSYTETTADEMRKLLEESEAKGKDENLYRKDSDDSNASDETDLSADIDIDSALLVKESDTKTPKAAAAAVITEEEEEGRVSKIFDEDEDKPKKKGFLKSEMSKSSDELRVVKPLNTSSKSTEAYLEDDTE